MPSVLAIVSKAIFERDAKLGGRLGGLGDVVPLDRYVSSNKGLTPVAEGGALFLVTVRPPDEALWLVAVLESPTFEGAHWMASNGAKNAVPLTDVSALKDKLKFSTGAGMSAKKGALGMSLQTPRVLTDEDVALLRAACGASRGVSGASPSSSSKGHLNAHDVEGPTPCLCRKCLADAPERVTVEGLVLVRERAAAAGRFVWYWVPESLLPDAATLRRAVEGQLHGRAKAGSRRTYQDLDTVFLGDDPGDDE